MIETVSEETENCAETIHLDCTPDEILSKLGRSNRFLLSCILICGLTSASTSMTSMSAAFVTQSCTNCSSMQSIVDEFDLRGDDAYLSDMTTTAFMMGNMIGGIVLTHAADRYGRRPLLIICLCLVSVSGILAANSTDLTMFSVFRFIQGIFHTGGALGGWVLCYEYTCLEMRFFTTVWFGMSWVFGYCLVAPLAYFSPNWRWLILLVSSPQIIVAAWCYICVPESLHFLVSSKKEKHVSIWLEKANETSGVRLLASTQKIVITRTPEDETPSLLRELWQHKLFLVYITVLVYLWICDTFIYFGLSLYSTRLAGNIYLNYFLMGLVEVPAYIASPWIMNRIGRRSAVSLTHVGAAAMFFALMFVPGETWVTTFLWLAGKFSISCAYMCIYVFASEVFPTNIRNLSMGFCETMSRFGAMMAPFLTALSRISPHLPMIVLCSISLLASVLCFILPETKNRQLPSSIRESARRS